LIHRRLLAGIASSLLAAFLVTGCGSGTTGPSSQANRQLQASLSHYKTYLQKNSAKLSHWADTIVLKVGEGSFARAGSRYAAARVPYGHLAPEAQLFGNLNAKIDALEKEVLPDDFGGFHELEKTIFWEKETTGMSPVAKQLRINVEELGHQIDSADLQPRQILEGADRTLEGVLANEIWGAAEPWAHLDLVDIAAKVEGVDAALKGTMPILTEENPAFATRIEDQLQKTFVNLRAYGILANEPEQARDQEPGISFVVYDQVTQEERWQLAQPIKGLAALLLKAKTELDS
jgi:iron uptake system component EfeO